MLNKRPKLHRESKIQDHLVNRLVTGLSYRRRTCKVDYCRTDAMDKGLTIKFLKSTQPSEWVQLREHYPGSHEKVFFKRLDFHLKKYGLIYVLRNGISVSPGIRFLLCFFKPASNLEKVRVREYDSNIMSVMKEVMYSKKCKNSIDVVLFLNGLPIITMEIKNLLTGTSYRDAESQYRNDRPPAGEKLLTAGRGALVHFALDQNNVSITTKLRNGQSNFLPFNRGYRGGAGNPEIPGELPIAYLYSSGEWGKPVFAKEVLLDIIGKFVYDISAEGSYDIIFPRFHQLDTVRSLIEDIKVNGAGKNYLIQHSAGSGKSNTIGWLAHCAVSTHDANDNSIFDTVIVISDRIVLDLQLQNKVSSLSQVDGVVQNIDGTSKQLKNAILRNAKIIVTTVQKFSTDHLKNISSRQGRRYAVIIDEAHSGQSGKNSQAITGALTIEDATNGRVEDIIDRWQSSRGPQQNISFFAFTATPRSVTLERFGEGDSGACRRPFHLYPMRQAIEEEFILNVLENYTTYQSYYELRKTIEEDPKLEKWAGRRRVQEFAQNHRLVINRKVEIIIDHFCRHVSKEINGNAKAMVVAMDRRQALKYYLAFCRYIESNSLEINVLVAFSGELQYEGKIYTESKLNGFSETELPDRFDNDTCDDTLGKPKNKILVVANKYQTGFDQPKLCAMYVDQKLRGIRAVQTLSRLNRVMKGKNNTYVLDFKNSFDEIKSSFGPFYEAARISEVTDVSQIYILREELFRYGYVEMKKIERFSEIVCKSTQNDDEDRLYLEELVRHSVRRYEADGDRERQIQFCHIVGCYCRFYLIVSQMSQLADSELEKIYLYCEWLLRLIPIYSTASADMVDDEMLDLESFKVEMIEQGAIVVDTGEIEENEKARLEEYKSYSRLEMKELSKIIMEFNEVNGTQYTEHDIIEQFEDIEAAVINDRELMIKIVKNPEDVVYDSYRVAFHKECVSNRSRNRDIRNIFLTDSYLRDLLTRYFFKHTLRLVSKLLC